MGKAAKTKEQVGARIEDKEITVKEDLVEEPVQEVAQEVEEVKEEVAPVAETVAEETPVVEEAVVEEDKKEN